MPKKRTTSHSKQHAKLGSNPKPKDVAPSPCWTLDAGISYSLLCRFMNCRERFRLYAVEGVREGSRWTDMRDWGTYFHELLELHAKHPSWGTTTIFKNAKKGPGGVETKTAQTVFTKYLWWFSQSKYDYIDGEIEFFIPYQLPNGRTVNLVGKTDEILHSPRNDGTLWIQENKTKSRFDEYKIESSIPHDLQTLMYAVAMQAHYNKPIGGVVYNVIRNPTLKPSKVDMSEKELAVFKKKNPKSKAKTRTETQAEFLTRLSDTIENDPKHYFKRWEFPLTTDHIERWRATTFDPLLTQLCMWWDSIKHDPFSPWTTHAPSMVPPDFDEMIPNPHHFQRPFGVYEPMTNGHGDFFDLITRNRRLGTTRGHQCFEELSPTHPARNHG